MAKIKDKVEKVDKGQIEEVDKINKEEDKQQHDIDELLREWMKKDFNLSDSEIDQMEKFLENLFVQERNEFLDSVADANDLNNRQKTIIAYIYGKILEDGIIEGEGEITETGEIKDIKCGCGEKAQFFHSRCCGAHMEGVITPEGEFQVVCEACGKYVGTLLKK